MKRLEEFIRELCPDRVDCVPIGAVVNYEQPSKYIVNSTKYSDEFPTPVLTAGQTFVLGYTDEESGIYQASPENPVIIFDDFTGAFQWVDFPFKVKSSAMKILTAKSEFTTTRYIYHIMGHIGFTSVEHKRLWIGKYSKFTIPLPPAAVQQEVVRILDGFMDLKHELNAEMQARERQYAYYRDTLLDCLKGKN